MHTLFSAKFVLRGLVLECVFIFFSRISSPFSAFSFCCRSVPKKSTKIQRGSLCYVLCYGVFCWKPLVVYPSLFFVTPSFLSFNILSSISIARQSGSFSTPFFGAGVAAIHSIHFFAAASFVLFHSFFLCVCAEGRGERIRRLGNAIRNNK